MTRHLRVLNRFFRCCLRLRRLRRERCGSRPDVVERVDDSVDHFLDQHAVVALAGDADHRLGAGRPHDQPAVAVEALFRVGDRAADLAVLVRLAAVSVAELRSLIEEARRSQLPVEIKKRRGK